jgi:hypothetical protein
MPPPVRPAASRPRCVNQPACCNCHEISRAAILRPRGVCDRDASGLLDRTPAPGAGVRDFRDLPVHPGNSSPPPRRLTSRFAADRGFFGTVGRSGSLTSGIWLCRATTRQPDAPINTRGCRIILPMLAVLPLSGCRSGTPRLVFQVNSASGLLDGAAPLLAVPCKLPPALSKRLLIPVTLDVNDFLRAAPRPGGVGRARCLCMEGRRSAALRFEVTRGCA